ncbi:MAG: hypothetical protein HWN65_09650 [Candidatus Helarchaeota archaeon]|nr:hypothetical protein [Candidatus Helarchaeota archaeon]
MKILLINPPIRLGHKPSFFPIGLGHIAQILLNEVHKVDVLDINAERLSNVKVLERINVNSHYDLIGTGGLITIYNIVNYIF